MKRYIDTIEITNRELVFDIIRALEATEHDCKQRKYEVELNEKERNGEYHAMLRIHEVGAIA